MTPRGRGTILVTGATASVRGGVGYSAFAGAKHALRALAAKRGARTGAEGRPCRACADRRHDRRSLRPLASRPMRPQRLAREEILDPDEIARNYVFLHRQRRSAWTFEMDLRPFCEPW